VNQILTKGIVLSRTDYGEADRIITLLTPSNGKLRLMARGVRKIKSKLAGGIELFSVSDITYITGKGDIGTLISSRLDQHYGNIVGDLDRVQLGYELIKLLNKATEDHPEAEYFQLLQQTFEALNDVTIDLDLIRIWFEAHLLKLSGHTPNLTTDTNGDKLAADQAYNFDLDAMTLTPHAQGSLNTGHIKVLRLIFDHHKPSQLQKVQDIDQAFKKIAPLVRAMLTDHIRI
jgi:DNA repair protein RecO (recombination protein O)